MKILVISPVCNECRAVEIIVYLQDHVRGSATLSSHVAFLESESGRSQSDEHVLE